MTTITNSQIPYISIFDAYTVANTVPQTADLIENVTASPDRSKVSVGVLSRLREFDAANNRLSTYLQPIDATETGLESLRAEVVALQALAEEALALRTAPAPQAPADTPASPAARAIEARSSTSIDETTLINGAGEGMRLSISADNGEDFTFTLPAGPTTWGQVAEAINAADFGVRARFDRSGSDGPRLVLESADGRTGFRLNGSSSAQVVDDLGALTSPYDGAYAAAKFTDGIGSGVQAGNAGPQGLTFGAGGSLLTGAEGTIAAGSSLRFVGADGVPRRWTATADTSLRSMMLDINAMRGSVVAELTAERRLRLRDTQGGDVTLGAATGSFAAAGPLAFARDVTAPPQPGLPADAIAARPNAQIDRDTLVSGAQNGMRFSITSDSGANFTYTFGMDADTITWGQVADALNLADIGVKMRFDENQIGSPRLTLYAVDDATGFRLDGASSRQVVDDLFGLASPYDGPFQASMFVDGARMRTVGVDATEHGMTFGRGGAVKAIAATKTLPVGSSVTFTDGDGIRRHWSASGSNTSVITFIEDIKAMNGDVAAEFATDGSLRLRSKSGRDITVLEGTGAFDTAEGPQRFERALPPPATAADPTTAQKITSLGRVLNARLSALSGQFTSLAYLGNVAPNELFTSASALNAAMPWAEWASSEAMITATRDALTGVLGTVDATTARLTDRLTTLHSMETSYRDLGEDLKNFAVEMLDSYLSWEEARDLASEIKTKLAQTTASMGPDQARDLMLLLG